jgi:hypothetical protein
MAEIDKNLEIQLKEIGISFILHDKYMNVVENPTEAIEMIIYEYEPVFKMKTIKLPKTKLVDFDYIMNKINTEKIYQNFANNFRQLLVGSGFENSINVYPTTYGIGFFVLFNFRNNNHNIKLKIDEILNNKGIEYKNEFSDAGWVFRYKISKSKENIERLV